MLIIAIVSLDVNLLSVVSLDLWKLHNVGVVFLAKRETVQVDVTAVVGKIKSNGWSASTFCKKMGRSITWVSEWKKLPPKNLPSPEEAARMCAILGVEPVEILADQSDIVKVTALLEAERPKKIQLATEDDELNKRFLAIWEGLTEENRRRVEDYIELLANSQRNQ